MGDSRAGLTQLEMVLEAYGDECVYCSLPLEESNASVEHVRCSCEDGSNWIGNLLPACSECNSGRSNTPAEEWIEECLNLGAHVRLDIVKEALIRLNDPHSYQSYWMVSRYPPGHDSLVRYQQARYRREAWRIFRATAETVLGEDHLALQGILHIASRSRELVTVITTD